MTFLATFLDLMPMAIGFGRGSEANVPLARAVVGGLLTSTCLTLFVVPILYTLLMKEGDVNKAEAELEAELADLPWYPRWRRRRLSAVWIPMPAKGRRGWNCPACP